jgi:hypothetical protein
VGVQQLLQHRELGTQHSALCHWQNYLAVNLLSHSLNQQLLPGDLSLHHREFSLRALCRGSSLSHLHWSSNPQSLISFVPLVDQLDARLRDGDALLRVDFR